MRAEMVSSDFNSVPIEEGWDLVQQFCDPTLWIDDGTYSQRLDFEACGPPPQGGHDSYVRSIDSFVGSQAWFFEFRVLTTGDRSEIPGGAPAVLVAFNAFGEDYTAVVARDQVKLFRDALLPVLFFDLTPGVFHRIRLELDNAQPPTYEWFIDSTSVDFGLAEDTFPSDDARITWRGKAWFLPTENTWDYIRYGDIAIDGSADFNSDGEVNEFELFYIDECIQRSLTGENVHPSCGWADVNSDFIVDCADWQIVSETMWTGPDPPPELPSCIVDLNPIPAVSDWGVGILLLLALTAGTVVFRHRHQPNL